MTQEDNEETETTLSENEELRKQYHPAFCSAMIQIFEHDGNRYEYDEEYDINTLPNRIDLLVIKVVDNDVIDKDTIAGLHGLSNVDRLPVMKDITKKENDIKKTTFHNGIGRICRKYNIFEYKSPRQPLSIDEFYKTMGYAYLYACSNKECSIDDVTITFVREGRPKKLLSFFNEKGYNITEYEKGIYHVLKKDHIDIQVIVTRELGNDYLWLKALSDNMTLEDAIRLVQAAEKETDIEGRKRIESILNLTSRLNANKDWMKEGKDMQAFRYLFEDEFKEKDKKIEDLSEQLQNQSEQLQSKDKEVKSLKEEIEHLKELLKQNKIAMF